MLRYPIFIALSMASQSFAQQGESPRRRVTYAEFVAAVESNNPGARIDESLVKSAKAAAGRAGTLSDPQVVIGREDMPLPGSMPKGEEGETEPPMPRTTVALTQSFPWPGTLAAEERSARARIGTAEIDQRVARVERSFFAKELFLRLVAASKLLKLQKANVAVVDSLRDLAHARFEQGIGSHMEFLQTRSESAILRTNVASLETDLRNLEARALLEAGLAGAGDVPAVTFELEWPPELVGAKTPTAGADLVREQIDRAAKEEFARKDAESRRTLPTFMAGAMLMQEEDGMRMYGASVGMTVPLFSGIRRRSIAEESGIDSTKLEVELGWHDKRRALALSQASSRLAQIETNAKSLREEIIPSVKEHVEATTIEYSQGRSNVTSVIEGRRMLLELEGVELSTQEALARACLGLERIAAGLVESEIDATVPQLSVSMGKTISGMPGTMEGAKGMTPMKRRPMTKDAGRSRPMQRMEPEEPRGEGSSNSMPGM